MLVVVSFNVYVIDNTNSLVDDSFCMFYTYFLVQYLVCRAR